MAMFVFDDFRFDDVSFSLTRGGKPLKVDAQVLEMLLYLLNNAGRVVTKAELIEQVWQGRLLSDNIISVSVAKLRKVLGGSKDSCIGSVYGRGYRFLRVVKRIETPSPAPMHVAPRPAPPLVGRSDVLASLKPIINQARHGRGLVCAVIGEAGIGKTRLAEALEHFAQRHGFAVTWCHCHRLDDVPTLWPFVKLMRSWEKALEGIEEIAAVSGADDWTDKGNRAWREIVLSVLDAIAKRAAERPQLIVLEDVHWADRATLQLLSHVLSVAKQHRLLFVITLRDQPLEDAQCRRTLEHIVGHRDCLRVPLTRLSPEDVEMYVHKLIGKPNGRVAEVVFDKSQGNPFFMVELLRPFREGDKPNPADIRLPEPALNIVRQVLERLASTTREILAAASVLGRSFDLGTLSRVTELKPQELVEPLESAMDMNVITAARKGATRWRFSHDLMREVLYTDLPTIERIHIHARTARVLAARAGADASVSRAEVAHHMLSGLPVIDGSEAIASARRAAVEAESVGAYADASELLRRALDALPLHMQAGADQLCELLFELARCERAAGEPFAKHLERAVTIAHTHGHRGVLVAAGRFACGSPGTIRADGASEIIEGALAALPEDAPSERSILLSQLSWTPPHNWSQEKVDALLDRAEGLAARASSAAHRAVLHARLYYASGPDDFARAEELCHTLELLELTRNPRKRAAWDLEPSVARMVAHLQRGQQDLAREAADRYGAAARTLRHAELLWHYDRMLMVLRMNAGEYVFSARALTELKRRAEQLELFGRKTLEAIDFSELRFQTAVPTQPPAAVPPAWRPRKNDTPLAFALKLRVLCQLGCVGAARAELETFEIERLQDIPKSRDYLATLGHFAYACVETGSRQQAALVYRLLAPYPHLCLVAMSLHSYGPVARTLGQLAVLLDERACARAHFSQALIDAERFGLLPQLALTRYQLAELLCRGTASDIEHARALASDARSLANSLGMAPLSVACQQLRAAGAATVLAEP